MQTPKNNQISRDNDPEWHFLAEYSLSKYMAKEDIGDELTAGMLFQATQDLGMPLEFLQRIESTLIEFAKEAMVHFSQDRLDLPVHIRLFYRKKTVEEINSAKTSSHFDAEPITEPTQISRHSDTKMDGGWGYFLIERGGGFTPSSSVSPNDLIDLYLYKEGE